MYSQIFTIFIALFNAFINVQAHCPSNAGCKDPVATRDTAENEKFKDETILNITPLDYSCQNGIESGINGLRENFLMLEMNYMREHKFMMDKNSNADYLQLDDASKDPTLTEPGKYLKINGIRTILSIAEYKNGAEKLRNVLKVKNMEKCGHYYFPRDFTTDAYWKFLSDDEDDLNFS
ncbi:hypothetical protein BdWA1_002626 [Babesia duncani]|uniref:Uncharacterized protein n=1 Tax=Babesia duncani TaxID=323732 RepID=A0AAD9UNH5_9APIC|nr:hypothetical protein BdWA1_002626 [Babesia duncani]